jgi:predicted AlkP superfamily phosphohydrolase/phosphomutase
VAPRVLAIGLDGVDRDLLIDWSRAGTLPVIRQLLASGRLVPLTSPDAMGDDATWASFSTSCAPGVHGRYFYRKLVPGSYATPMFRGDRPAREPFWGHLSTAGRRVAVLDVPKTPLAASVNGVQLADWQVHGPDLATHSYPADLAERVLTRFGGDRVDRWHGGVFLCGMRTMSAADHGVFYGRLVESISDKTDLAEELLEQEPWDLFLVVFKEGHCIGHQCWHLHDSSHPESSPALRERYGDPIREIYKALDSSIGRLLAHAAPDTHVLVFTDLGMRSNFTGDHLLDDVLMRLEWGAKTPLAHVYHGGLQLQERLRLKVSPQARWGIQRFRRAYQVPHNEISGAIRINLIGREPHGKVRAGIEFDELCDRLTDSLLDLRETASGRPAVCRVVRADRQFPGPCRGQLPDLLVEWERHTRIEGLSSTRIGTVARPAPGYRTGNHVSGGVLLAAGPAVKQDAEEVPASIMDLGPTIATLLGCPLAGVDGRPLSLFER